MIDPAYRQTVVVAVGTLAVLLLWHLSPLALWHLRFEAELVRAHGAERLESPSRTLGAPAPTWRTLRVGNLTVEIPLADPSGCERCGLECVLPLEEGGTFAVFAEPPPEDLGQALDRFAPDPSDLSVWRSVMRNWETIDALTDRARAPGVLPDATRFRAAGSRGIVTAFTVDRRRRFVVYAYGPEGEAARVLGATGVPDERLDRILGGLVVAARPDDGTASCR